MRDESSPYARSRAASRLRYSGLFVRERVLLGRVVGGVVVAGFGAVGDKVVGSRRGVVVFVLLGLAWPVAPLMPSALVLPSGDVERGGDGGFESLSMPGSRGIFRAYMSMSRSETLTVACG